MSTVPRMLKRIFAIGSGVLLGTILSIGTVRMAALWGWLPDSDLNEASAAVREVMKLVNHHYVEADGVAFEQLRQSALSGIAGSLDPHSVFMPEREYQRLQEDIDSEFGGIGVQVEMSKDEERVVVVAPIEGTPGDRAGILRGDEIVGVDGQALEKLSLDEVVSKLRGKPRTVVRVEFRRPSEDRKFEVEITRELIHVDSVKGGTVDADGIGYVQITHFAEATGKEFVAMVSRMRKAGMKALVLDLRNNPGGLLTEAAAVSDPFFERDELIVYTQGREPGDRQELRAGGGEPRLRMPVAVIVNGGSASASEIVAGALKDTHRAIIVGEKSFGKGSVQTIFPLNNGAGLRLTTARYYTPSGVTIHEKGIEPDVEVKMTPEEEKAVALQRLRPDVSDPAEFKDRFGVEQTEDRPLEKAREVLREKLRPAPPIA